MYESYESEIVANDRDESRSAAIDDRGDYRKISGVWVHEDKIPSPDEIDWLGK